MKRIISIAILFLLVGVGYVHADVIYTGDLNFAVSNIEEKPYGTASSQLEKIGNNFRKSYRPHLCRYG